MQLDTVLNSKYFCRSFIALAMCGALAACGGGSGVPAANTGADTSVDGNSNGGATGGDSTAGGGNGSAQSGGQSLISMDGQWLSWSGEAAGIYKDGQSGYLVLPAATSGQDYVYGVQEFNRQLTGGTNYTLEVATSDPQAKVQLLLRDASGGSLPLNEFANGVVVAKEWGVVTGAGTLQFSAPANVTKLFVQVQGGWRATTESRVFATLTTAAGQGVVDSSGDEGSQVSGDSLLNLGGSWLTWNGTDSGIWYDANSGRLVVSADSAGSRTGVRQYDVSLSAASEYTAFLDASNPETTARLYLYGSNGAIDFVDADTGISRDWHSFSKGDSLRFTPPAGVTRVIVQVQGPWQASESSSAGLSLVVSGAGVTSPPGNSGGDTGGNTDGGNTDGGNTDGGNTDGGNTDGGNTDGGSTDGGNTDGGNTDGGNTGGGTTNNGARPRVAVLTDINYAGGDPDDSQSLIHMLWYADELDIRAIVPDSWSGGGYTATMDAIAGYESDYNTYGLSGKGYTAPSDLRSRVAGDQSSAINSLIREADASSEPLYVLIWGSMTLLRDALYQRPDLVSKFRVLTIASAQMYDGGCTTPNWNAGGRNDIFNDSRFDNLWWIESNWTYNGMFDGQAPVDMLNTMTGYGTMGWLMKDVVKDFGWAQYFRAGDTPTVLYLLDPSNNLDNPTQGSWAGQFSRPLGNKPNFYADSTGGVYWDFANPCNTWGQKDQVYNNSKATLESRRDSMYSALLSKLNWIYGR